LRLPEPWLSFISLDGERMQITFTPEQIRHITWKDLAALRADFSSHPDKDWVDQMAGIIEDLRALASQNDRDPVAVSELERRVSAFLEDRRNKGMTPYLYMVRALKPGAPTTI